MKTLFQVVKEASKRIDTIEDSVEKCPYVCGRTLHSVLASAMSEFGELAEEVNIHGGHSYKTASEDGVVGEAVDTIACLLDLIHVYNPQLTEHDIMTMAAQKCAKWVSKVAKNRGIDL
jgi:NTP pyrophosphatase (non-canonical NTP hydrolase)